MFKVGDIVLVRPGSSYNYTTPGSFGKVVSPRHNMERDKVNVEFYYLASKWSSSNWTFAIHCNDLILCPSLIKALYSYQGDE